MENKPTGKLLKRSEFLELRKSGKRYSPVEWILINFKKNTFHKTRFGVTTTKKVGSAVIRNKLKRWTREYFRTLHTAGIVLNVDINVIFKPMDAVFYRLLSYSEFKKAMDKFVFGFRKNS